MARPPRLPKLEIPSLSPGSHQTARRSGETEKLPLTAVERGRGMVVPPTPVIVPPTPVIVPPTPVGGSHSKEEHGRERQAKSADRVSKDGSGGKDSAEGKKDERKLDESKSSRGTKDQDPVSEQQDDSEEVVIVQSPEAEEPDISTTDTSPASSSSKHASKDTDKTSRPSSPTSADSNKTGHKSQERKSSFPTGRSRSRSGSSSSQCSGMAPRRNRDEGKELKSGSKEKGEADATVESPTEVAVVDSPVEELVFDSPVDEVVVASPAEDDGGVSAFSKDLDKLSINETSQTAHALDPRTAASPSEPMMKSDSAIPAMQQQRSHSPEQKQIYDVISTSPTASACETPCLDRAAHKALHRDDPSGFFPVQEDAHEDDEGDPAVAESPGGLSDDGWGDFSAVEDGDDGSKDVSPTASEEKQRDREAERKHVQSMNIAKVAALSHSTDELHASRKRSEGFSPGSTESGGETPGVKNELLSTPGNGKGKERMLSVDDAVSETSSRGRGHPGHHRRESSTHRVRETLNAKHYSSEMGERLVNQYKIQKLLGKGAYGNVYKAIDVGTGTEYALKEFSKNRLGRQHHLDVNARQRRAPRQQKGESSNSTTPSGEDSAEGKETSKEREARLSSRRRDPLSLIRREIAVMKKLDHPNLVLLYEAIDVPTSDSLYLVLEFMSGGTIMDVKLGDPAIPLDTEVAREYFRQLVLGLEYLHENDVAHRDIKPDNILLSADRTIVKLCDFGVSDFFHHGGDDLMQKNAGSPAFMSPEAAVSSERGIHAKAVDIWSLGVTLYCLLRGRLPFEAENPLDLYEAIRDKPVPVPHEWDEDVKDLIRRMLTKDPRTRIEMSALREHPWVTFGGTHALPTTEENLYTIGKQVVEPTQEELGAAITSFRQLFTVLKVIQRLMRNVKRNRRTMSSSSYASSSALMSDSPTSSAPGTPDARPTGAGYFSPLAEDTEAVTASPLMIPVKDKGEGGGGRFSLDD